MPLYDYRCRACSKVTEVRHGFGVVHQDACPECGGELARVFSPTGIVFKGSGFYLTDSRKASEKAKSAASESGTAAEPAKPAETAKAAESTSTPATPAPATSAPAASTAPATPAPKSESSAA
ncbi:MAG TPA: FmdB family zinc ribbon protein [Xanthomonadales bacterium]|nr:FmdB family zinc ribbon protein [Xanthomonadales bacterium]